CTTIIVGSKQMADGSMIYARSDDSTSVKATKLAWYPAGKGPDEFVALDSPFRCPLPPVRRAFSALERADLPYHWGEAGFNDAGVGMSATETIFSKKEVLDLDPYVESGLAENCVFQIILPYVESAREGVLRLGELIEKYGSAEGFGIAFMDENETWYLENAGGHRWLAKKMPEDKYFVSGNQSRYREYDPKVDLASADLVEWAREHKLFTGKFDFHEAYCLESENDKTYNYPRVWYLQQMFTPSVKTDVKVNNFPVYQKADRKLTVDDIKKAFRSHYDGTDHDPYLHNNPKEPYRPVSIFRTINTHILQVRPGLPKEIGRLDYMAEGMADLCVYLPLYQGVTSYPKAYGVGRKFSQKSSAYWTFRKVAALGMVDYNKYAPIIKKRYAALEAEMSDSQKKLEAAFIKMSKGHKDAPAEAINLLQKWSDRWLTKALRVASDLEEKLFTELTKDIETVYKFHGA
ncbi:MAG: C69 family dipeptidase, partial [Bacteroidales bacterium]|nr:C69 family dipeptidase [Bacteroidales bacterium]